MIPTYGLTMCTNPKRALIRGLQARLLLRLCLLSESIKAALREDNLERRLHGTFHTHTVIVVFYDVAVAIGRAQKTATRGDFRSIVVWADNRLE